MTITIDITPGHETVLRRQAERNGLTLDVYMRRVLEQLADHEEISGDGRDSIPTGGLPKNRHPVAKRPRQPYNPAGLVAALESFGREDAEEQRRTLEYLETAIDRDRPGQRRIFDTSVNPMPSDEAP